MCGVSLGVVRHAWERVGVVGQDISVQCGFLGSGLWDFSCRWVFTQSSFVTTIFELHKYYIIWNVTADLPEAKMSDRY